MKKKLLLTLLGASCVLLLPAQTSYRYTIAGTVKDSVSGTAEPYVTLRLLAPGTNRAIAVATTDANGRFTAGTNRSGTYDLQVSSIGMRTITRRLTLTASHTDVGTLLMSEITSSLGEATVTAQRPIVKTEVDRISYNMSDDPEAQTNSLLDMLRKVPMVTVDGEDNIKVNGSSGFKVYVNGKPNQMMSSNPSMILKNYPASAIKKVEVITDPGAKYDAEGVTGILNIVTDAETKSSGYTVTPNISYSNRGYFGNVFAMAQVGKLKVSANYGIGHHSQPYDDKGSERETFNDATNYLLTSVGKQKSSGTFQFGSLDASYEFDAKNLLSISAGLNSYHGRHNTYETYRMTAADATQIYAYDIFTSGRDRYDGYNANADYQHTFSREGQSLTLSYRFNTSPGSSKEDTYYSGLTDVPYALKDRVSDPDNHSSEHTAQADFVTPLGQHHTFAAGLKYIYRINSSDSHEWTRPSETDAPFGLDAENSISYRHRADIAAAYSEYTLKAGDFTARAGLRYEFSHFRINYPDGRLPGFSNDFNDLVPSINLGYSLSQATMVKAGYNMRIGRPDISYLSPYVVRPTAESVSYGNPNLNSEKAHNFKVSFSRMMPKLSISTTLAYMLQTNGLTPYSFLDSHNVTNRTYGNFKHAKELKLSAYINWAVTNGTVLNLNLSGGYADYKAYHYYGDYDAHNHGFNGDGFASLRQDLPLKLKLSLYGGGRTTSPYLQGREASFYFYGLNLSRSLLEEDRLTLTLMAGNFLHPKHTFRNTTQTADYRSSSFRTIDMMRIGFGVRYRLGSLKTAVKKATRTIDNSDVMKQSGNNGSEDSGSQQRGM